MGLMLAGVSAAPAGKDAHGSALAMDRINQLLQRPPPKRVDAIKCAVPHPVPQNHQVGLFILRRQTLSRFLDLENGSLHHGVGLSGWRLCDGGRGPKMVDHVCNWVH